MPASHLTSRRDLSANFWIQVALWLAYLGIFARALGPDNNFVRHGGRFLYDISAVILILASLPRLLALPQQRHTQFNGVMLMLAAGAMAALVGLVKGNDMVRWVLMGFLPFMSASVSLLGDGEGLFECLLRTMIQQLWLGVLFAGAVLLFARPEGRMEWNGEFGDGIAKMATRSLYMVHFILPYLGRFRRRHNVLLGVAYLELIVLHIIGANRGPIIVLVVVMPGLIFMSSMANRDGFVALRRLSQVGVMALLLFTPMLNLVVANDPTFLDYSNTRVSELLLRMSGTSTDDDLLTTSEGVLATASDEFLGERSRGGELRDFWQQLEPVDFVCGRGFGGSWMSSFWGGEWHMVHVGPAHLLLVGGIPLLIAFGYMLLASILAAWQSLGTHPAATGTFCYLAVFATGFIQHGAIQDGIEVSLFWVLTGLAFSLAPALSQTARRPAAGAYRTSLRQPQPTH